MGWAVWTPQSAGLLIAIGQGTVLAGALLGFAVGQALRRRLVRSIAIQVEKQEAAYEDAVQRGRALLSNVERIAQLGSAERDLTSATSVWTDGFFAVLGLEPGQCVPSTERFLECVHPADLDVVRSILEQAIREERRVEEYFRIIRPDGEIRVLQGRADVGRDETGKATQLDSILQDVTDRKRLEDELDGLIRELWRSNEELEQFAYVASHDLRQPLRVVGSYVTLMEEELQGNLNDDAQEYMSFVRDGVRRMDRLITDLLTYSRVGRTSTDQPVCMGKAAEAAVTDLQFEIEEAQATVVTFGTPPSVMGDESEMERLFQNLIGNAIKYHRPDHPPRVQITYEDKGEMWRVTVSDNGIGIPPEHAERIFGIFQRLHARNEFEGTGVGLAIVKKIVERHGGAIRAEPGNGEGTTMAFTWPKLREGAEVS